MQSVAEAGFREAGKPPDPFAGGIVEGPRSPADPVFNLRRAGGGKGHLWRLFRTKAEAIVYMVESYGRESEGAEWARALGIDSFEDLVSRYSSAPGEPPP